MNIKKHLMNLLAVMLFTSSPYLAAQKDDSVDGLFKLTNEQFRKRIVFIYGGQIVVLSVGGFFAFGMMNVLCNSFGEDVRESVYATTRGAMAFAVIMGALGYTMIRWSMEDEHAPASDD